MYRKSVTEIKIDVLDLSLYIQKHLINFKKSNKMKSKIHELQKKNKNS